MTKERFNEIITNLKFEKNKWYTFSEIDSIFLEDGRGIYPNWMHMRFLINEKDEILIQHGNSKPYGARLSTNLRFLIGYRAMQFHPSSFIIPTKYYTEFRYPKSGDVLIVSNGKNSIINEAIITSISVNPGLITIDLTNPIIVNQECNFSFFDPSQYEEDKCIHGTEEEGIYMKFFPNSGKNYKNFGVFHEIIKIKNIKEINLRLYVKDKKYRLN